MDILQATALEQAKLIAERKISCLELTKLYLDRIERLNPRVQAFVDVYRKDALRTARQKDERVRSGEPLPRFHGVPIGIKDLNMVRGKRTRFGSRGFIPFWSPLDDLSVSPLRRAGFVILGKLATSELGAVPITEPDIHPPTRNPWNLDYTSGGSSGGSAAAIAAGFLSVAHGSDGGGSIRIPASFTGLVGLKPARGRLPNQFALPDQHIIYTTGALTRTVDDSAELLDIMAGITSGKPHWAKPPEEPFAKLAMKRPPRLRIRLSLDTVIVKADPEVRAAILSTAKLLTELGHFVEEVPAPEASVDEFLPLWCHLIASTPLMRWSRVQPVTRWLREGGRSLKTRDVLARQQALEARLLDWFGQTDIWLTPTVPVLPPKVGAFASMSDPKAFFYKVAEIGAFTAISNVTGQPAISVPAGVSREGLPIGAQLIGRPQDEALLLQVARQLEQARPWRDQTPRNL